MALVGEERECRECAEEFEVTRQWQLFCGGTCRIRYNRRHYGACFYCGAPGDHRDHIDPVVHASLTRHRLFRNIEFVFACRPCNSILGGNRFDGIIERFRFLASRYELKLGPPKRAWDGDEIEELGIALRRKIKRILAKEREYRMKIEYLLAVAEALDRDIGEL